MDRIITQPISSHRIAILAAALSATMAGAADQPKAPVRSGDEACLPSGDGYLRARLGGSLEAQIDWPNSGTHCDGELKDQPPGVRLSFRRSAAGAPDLLFVFGLTGVREGQPARSTKTNLTLIVQGTSQLYSTLGDSRCTVDSLTQRRLPDASTNGERAYRLEARGFCTAPAHAVRGDGGVLVSTFDFAGIVKYEGPVPDK